MTIHGRGSAPPQNKMKKAFLSSLTLAATILLVGCGSEKAPGYDAASSRAAENLAKAGNDLSKLSAEDRAALEKAAKGYPGGGGVQGTTGGGGGAPGEAPRRDSGMPQGYMSGAGAR